MGARQLSALVKNEHTFSLICYGEYHHETFSDTAAVGDAIDERLLTDLLRSLSPDLVGFSYRSVQSELVTHLARRIRSELGLPVIFGGIGATSEPDRFIEEGEIVCVGEGDFVLPQLLNAIDNRGSVDAAVRDVPNLWHRADSGVVKNALERLVSADELSAFPYLDYDGANKYSIVRGKLIENDGRYDNEVGAYPMLTSRGCPFACTFCHNSNVHDLYRGQRYCRQRSVDSVIDELAKAKAIPGTTMVSIYDDLFTFNREWALEFARRYKQEIALPFWCYTHPSKVHKDVFEALVDAGLNNTAMGVQSGSERTLYEIFNRKTSRAKILEAATVLKDLKCRAQIDLITANPFETDDDRRDTLDLMLEMPKNTAMSDHDRAWYYCQSRLTYFPNSRISQMVEEQGIDTHFDPDVASFWEMLHELAFMDHLPRAGVLYLSYLYEEYRASAKDFKPETGAEWIWLHLLDRPIRELLPLLEGETGESLIGEAVGWVPTVEELTTAEFRTLMDAAVPEPGIDEAEKSRRLSAARAVLRELSPERRVQRVKESLRSHAALVVKLADDIQHRAVEQRRLWEEVERRGKWGLERDHTVKERDQAIQKLQAELEERTRWALDMERQLRSREPV
jgi:radical SAM superfamily enzyme YgiQ (UPF0313 family)